MEGDIKNLQMTRPGFLLCQRTLNSGGGDPDACVWEGGWGGVEIDSPRVRRLHRLLGRRWGYLAITGWMVVNETGWLVEPWLAGGRKCFFLGGSTMVWLVVRGLMTTRGWEWSVDRRLVG